MFQVDMRFVERDASGYEKKIKCFYTEVFEEDERIKCGDFLFKYGREILWKLSRKKKNKRAWEQLSTNFPIKISFNKEGENEIVLDNRNIDQDLHLKSDNAHIFFKLERIPPSQSSNFSENVKFPEDEIQYAICDLAKGKDIDTGEVMEVEITLRPSNHYIKLMILKEDSEHTSAGLFLFRYGEEILKTFRAIDAKIPSYSKGERSFPMNLKFWDVDDDGFSFNNDNINKTLFWDHDTFNNLLLESIGAGEEGNFTQNVADPEYCQLDCPICIHSLNGPVFAGNIEDGEYNQLNIYLPPMDIDTVSLPCKHTLHIRCMLNMIMKGRISCPQCRSKPGEEWLGTFFEENRTNARYCLHFYENKLKETISKIYNYEKALKSNRDKEYPNDDEAYYLQQSIEKLKKDINPIEKIITAAKKEVLFFTNGDSERTIQTMQSLQCKMRSNPRFHMTPVQNSNYLYRINNVLDRILF